MSFNLDTWKAQLAARLPGWQARMPRADAQSIYGFLATATLWPVAEASRLGDWQAMFALGGVLANLGTNLTANLIQQWKDNAGATEATAATTLAESAAHDAALRAELDEVLTRLQTFAQAQTLLPAADQRWFAETLRAELAKLGNLATFAPLFVGAGGVGLQGDNRGQIVTGANARLVQQSGGVNFENVENLIVNPPPTPAPQPDPLAHYLQKLIDESNALLLTAMGGDASAGDEITLRDVYQALDTTATVKLTAQEKKQRKERTGRDEETRPLTALEAATQQRRLVLLGDPGSGKSTFVKHVAATLAQATLGVGKALSGWPADLTPLITELRNVARELAVAYAAAQAPDARAAALVAVFETHWQAQTRRMKTPAAWPAIEQALAAGKVFLVFDGLDEVPEGARAAVWQGVAALAHAYTRPHTIVVTCRIRSYDERTTLPGFTAYTLAPFDEAKIKAFTAAWYRGQAQLNRVPQEEVQARTTDFQRAALDPELRELAENPMLLTVMALIHQRDVGLPRQRVKLYREAVRVLMLRWQEQRGIPLPEQLAAVLKDEEKLRRILERLAYETHNRRQQKDASGDLQRGELLVLLEQKDVLGRHALAGDFLDYVDQRAGLLVGKGGSGDEKPLLYTFPHRTFQEYLAGAYLLSRPSVRGAFAEHAAHGDRWHLAAELGLEELWHNRPIAEFAFDLLADLCSGSEPTTEKGWRRSLWSGHLAVQMGAGDLAGHQFCVSGDEEIDGAVFLDRVRQRLEAIMRRSPLPALDRAEAGRLLAHLGDHRDEVTDVHAIAWCDVPAGSFLMGEKDKEPGYFDPTPQLPFTIAYAYRISRYPITNAQYCQFMAAGGYGEARYWVEAQAAGFWEPGRFKGRYDSQWRTAPVKYAPPFDLDNHPVVGVTWYEALAFTRWLDDALHAARALAADWCVRLPTEAEWEKAARGTDGRRFPWEGDPDPENANYDATRIGSTSAVGCFPKGASIYTVEECAGTVWEWTSSLSQRYPYDPKDGRETLAGGPDEGRILRGGAYWNGANVVGCGVRGDYFPLSGYDFGGFRVVAAPFTSGLCPFAL